MGAGQMRLSPIGRLPSANTSPRSGDHSVKQIATGKATPQRTFHQPLLPSDSVQHVNVRKKLAHWRGHRSANASKVPSPLRIFPSEPRFGEPAEVEFRTELTLKLGQLANHNSPPQSSTRVPPKTLRYRIPGKGASTRDAISPTARLVLRKVTNPTASMQTAITKIREKRKTRAPSRHGTPDSLLQAFESKAKSSS